MSEIEWQSSKQGIIAKMEEPDSNLRSRSQRLWQSIAGKDYDFNNQEKIVNAIAKMSRDQMIRFVVAKLKPKKASRLILHSCGENHQTQSIVVEQNKTIS